ncbi:MFS transporter [Micrococcus sp. GPGPB33]|uniref:MFS transporter n=1 Tax=Micrococcus sp. GPGPB33 TaxID=3023084 RepID=UPI0030C0F62F
MGALLLGAGGVSLMVPFIVPGTAWLLVLAAALVTAWWLWEKRVKARASATGVQPMVDPALFRRPSFTIGALESTIYLATMPAVFAIVAIFLQRGMGFTPLEAGLVGLPGAVVVASLSPWVGSMVQRRGPVLVLLGALVGLVSLGVLALAFERSAAGAWSPWIVGVGLIVQSASQALLLTSTQVLMMDDVAGHEAGAAGGVAQTAQRLGTALGLSVVTGAFFAALAGAAAESAGPPSAAAYAHAASTAMGMVAVCWALTAVVAALDVVRRRRAVRAA